jgi:hypothetical protein
VDGVSPHVRAGQETDSLHGRWRELAGMDVGTFLRETKHSLMSTAVLSFDPPNLQRAVSKMQRIRAYWIENASQHGHYSSR